MTAARRPKVRNRRRSSRSPGRSPFAPFAVIAATLERLADDSATLCDCADGRRCVA